MNRKEKRDIVRNFNKIKESQKRRIKGAFGKNIHFIGLYKTLKVIPVSQRDTITCNKLGVQI